MNSANAVSSPHAARCGTWAATRIKEPKSKRRIAVITGSCHSCLRTMTIVVELADGRPLFTLTEEEAARFKTKRLEVDSA